MLRRKMGGKLGENAEFARRLKTYYHGQRGSDPSSQAPASSVRVTGGWKPSQHPLGEGQGTTWTPKTKPSCHSSLPEICMSL